MRRDRFVGYVAHYLPFLRKMANHAGLEHDEADEVVGKCIKRLLDTKKYCAIEQNKLKAFLNTSIRFEVRHHRRDEDQIKIDCARLLDPELTPKADSSVTVANKINIEPLDETECPFCFQANLNEYGACAMCHTIVPSHRRIEREVIVMTEESLAVEFDFNKKIDVQNAIAQLTPYEQTLVTALGMGNESLESFAKLSDRHFTSIGRDWVRVKVKLQGLLSEYAPQGLSKRGESAFRRVIQSIEKTKKNEVC